MHQPATQVEIQRVRKYLPEAEVLGVLRDGKGLLLEIKAGSATQLHEGEKALLKAGASEWNWSAEQEGMQIRAYWTDTATTRWPLGAAVLVAAVCIWYDVHLAQNAAEWFAALQRSSGFPL